MIITHLRWRFSTDCSTYRTSVYCWSECVVNPISWRAVAGRGGVPIIRNLVTEQEAEIAIDISLRHSTT